MTIADLNAMSEADFAAALGWIFEHSPWVAERAAWKRPFADLDHLHRAMTEEVRAASREERLALLCAHPDLGTRARVSAASESEQAGAGLDKLTPEEFSRLQDWNAEYRRKFGFPFLFAVKGATKRDILRSLGERIAGEPEREFETALEQVYRIARFRLESATGEN